MKKTFSVLICLLCLGGIQAQDASSFLEPIIKKAFVLVRQDYILKNNETDDAFTQNGLKYYGRIYGLGVRGDNNNFIVPMEIVKPWYKDESIKGNDKYTPEISNTSYRTIGSVEFEPVEGAGSGDEIVPNQVYSINGSEDRGFAIDTKCGNKSGYAVWLLSRDAMTPDNDLTILSLQIEPFSITTAEGGVTYDLEKQPKGDVVGGIFIVTNQEEFGTIVLQVNGLFRKIGGIWKFVSMGTES